MEELKAGSCMGYYSSTDESCKKCLLLHQCIEKTNSRNEIKDKSTIEKLIEKCNENFNLIDVKKSGDKNLYILQDKLTDVVVYIAFDKKTNEIQTKINQNKDKFGILSIVNMEQIYKHILERIKDESE